MAQLSDCFTVVEPDGSGRSPAWRSERQLTLAAEVKPIAPIIERAGERFSLLLSLSGSNTFALTLRR